MEVKQRQTNFELLRLVSMFLIVLGHSIFHGLRHITSPTIPDIGVDPSSNIDMINFGMSQLLAYLTNVGVNLFILITGYFIITPKDFKTVLGKAFRLWRTIVFYAVFILAIVCISGYKSFSFNNLFSAITPIYHNTYWFMTQYIALFLLTPFLVKLLSNLSKREYAILLIILFCLTFQQENIGYGHLFSNNTAFLLFILLFCAGGYIRRFNPMEKYQRYGFTIYITFCIILTISGIYLQMCNLGSNGHKFLYIKGLAYTSFTLFYSVVCFLWFKTIRIQNSKINRLILMLSPHVFGIYLIHDNPTVREILWQNVKEYIHFGWFIPGLLIYVSLIFVSCLIIDTLRSSTSELLDIKYGRDTEG